MKERILVTGGTGYIGSHTVVELQNSGYDVVIVDNLSNSSADVVDNIEKVSGIRPAFEKLDCLDFEGMDKLFTKYPGIKGIIHFAVSHDDKIQVLLRINDMIRKGIYPSKLF